MKEQYLVPFKDRIERTSGSVGRGAGSKSRPFEGKVTLKKKVIIVKTWRFEIKLE
jgi:hypothetical protein